jgi:peptide/nickel transport system permease protein
MQKASPRGYWAITWQQIRKKKMAMISLWFVLGLLLLGTYAPYLASDVPFRIATPEGIRYPFFTELFNTSRFTAGVDIGYNLWSFMFIPLLIISYVFRKHAKWVFRLWSVSLSIFLVIFLILLYPAYDNLKKPFIEYVPEYYNNERSVFPIIPISFEANETTDNKKPPGYTDEYGRQFHLGTDDKSRGVVALLLYGTRISMTIGVMAVGIYVSIGVFLGALAGYFGGRIDMLISRLIEVMICFPTFLLIMTLVAFIPNRSIFTVMVVIGVTSWTGVARLVRAEFFKLREADFVMAVKALGGNYKRIIFRHILPNALGPIIVSAAFGVPSAILVESGLSFLGLGDVNSPSWGQILNAGRNTNLLYWLIHPPGIAIFLTVSAMNLLGDALRDALDPKLRGR